MMRRHWERQPPKPEVELKTEGLFRLRRVRVCANGSLARLSWSKQTGKVLAAKSSRYD